MKGGQDSIDIYRSSNNDSGESKGNLKLVYPNYQMFGLGIVDPF